MKRLALAMAAVFAAANALQAANPADILSMNAAGLEKAGFNVTVDGGGLTAPKPGIPQPVHQQPGYNHNPNLNNHNQPGNNHNPNWNNHNQPWNPQHPGWNPQHPGNNHPYPPVNPPYNPGYPSYPPVYPPVNPPYPPVNPPYPPVYPPYPPVQMQNFRFDSGSFVFSSDAVRSMENAALSLRRNGYTVLEKRNNFNSYTLVFVAPAFLKVEKYVSGNFVFSSDAQKAAEECVRAMESRNKVVLEKNVSGTSFTVSYLSTGYDWNMQTQTYTSGNFVFSSDAQRSMNETVAALQAINAVILEKRLNGTSYVIVYQAPFRLETQTYNSGNFVFSSDAARSMNETAAALQRVRNLVIMEKRQTGTSYTVVFLAPFKMEVQKYVSGNYVFSSDAQRAAGETAAALASQGMIVLEKNVSGTQFTITYFFPGYNY